MVIDWLGFQFRRFDIILLYVIGLLHIFSFVPIFILMITVINNNNTTNNNDNQHAFNSENVKNVLFNDSQ